MKKYISIMFLTLAIAGSSCKKDYLDLTVNPNVPSTSSPNLLLSGSLKNSAGFVNSGSYVMYAAWVGHLSQSTGFQPFVALEQYQFTTSSYDAWTAPYLNIANYTALQASTPEPYYQAIAKIMKAYMYQGLVDNYNNIPYTTAIQGTGNLNPTYDSGSAVYDDLLKQLDDAMTLISGATPAALNPAGSDIMFGGNMTKWAKFANTLKLRIALRQSNTTKTAALKAAVAATSAVGYIDASFDARVQPGYINSDASGGQQSPLWLYYGLAQGGGAQPGNAQYQANSFLADYLGSHADPRLGRIFSYSPTTHVSTTTGLLPGASINIQPGTTDAVVSTTFGDSQPPTGTIDGKTGGITPSKVGPGILKSATMPAIVMSSAEALFLQAEAANTGYITGDAQALYNAGVLASFTDLGAVLPAAYLAAGGTYAWPATATAQETAIITQKWIALAISGSFEAFNEERRTGIPNVPTSIYPGANAPNQVARIFYPFVEYATNSANVGAQGTIDKFTSKIFWAK